MKPLIIGPSGHATLLSSAVMAAFALVERPKLIPLETAQALKIDKVEGVNRLEVKAEGDIHHIYLSGSVGKSWWDDSGITEQEVRDALNSVPKGRKITAHINSEGGSVQEGLGIYNAFRDRRADLTAKVDGYAVSIASVIPLAAGTVISPKAAIWMIHNAWSWASGNADDMRQQAKMLEEHDAMLAEIYREHTGKSLTEIRAAMKAETWVRGSAAVAFGLADQTDEEDESESQARYVSLPAAYLERCKNCPSEILNALKISPAAAGQPQQKKGGGLPTAATTGDSMIKKIVALLKANKIEAAETDTEEQLMEKLTTLTQGKTGKELKNLKQQILDAFKDEPTGGDEFNAAKEIAALKKTLIVDRVNKYVDSTAITKDEVMIFVNAALDDEEGTFKILDGKKAARIGGNAAGLNIEEIDNEEPYGVAGNPTEKLRNLYAEHKGDKQKVYAAMKQDWNHLLKDAARQDKSGRVRNENTFSGTLTTNFLILGATTQLSPKFASVKMFSRDTSVDPYKPLATGVMKFNDQAQDGSTTLTNATNFELGDTDIQAVSITVAQYTEPFHIRNSDLNSGIRMEDLVVAKLASLGTKISKVIGAKITSAAYTTLAPIISAPGAFGFGDMATAWGELKKANRKNIMLDGEYLARIINTPVFLQAVPVVPGAGWKNVIGWDYVALHTDWSSAGNNIRGFACDPQALGVIAGLPLVDAPNIPGGILAMANGMLPGIELAIQAYTWFNTSTRVYWGSFDLMFGVNQLDTTAGLVVASGAPS